MKCRDPNVRLKHESSLQTHMNAEDFVTMCKRFARWGGFMDKTPNFDGSEVL